MILMGLICCLVARMKQRKRYAQSLCKLLWRVDDGRRRFPLSDKCTEDSKIVRRRLYSTGQHFIKGYKQSNFSCFPSISNGSLLWFFAIYQCYIHQVILLLFFSILLHANMLDWSTCSALVNVWLRTTQTATIHEYAAVVELYVINVLEPQERWEDVTAFLESCKNLPANIVAKLLQESHARKQEFMATQLQRNDDSTLEDNSDEIIQQRSQIREQPSLPSITQYSDIVGQNAIRFYFIKPFPYKFHIDDCFSLTASVNILLLFQILWRHI